MLSQAMAQRIEHRKLAELTPYPNNPRRIRTRRSPQIAGSIAAFGFNSPILVDSKGGIIAGHGRYLAALKLGLETVPVVVLDHLSEIEKRAYLLADNKLAELSAFDDDLLRAELAELRDAEIDLGSAGLQRRRAARCCWRSAERRRGRRRTRKRKSPSRPPSRSRGPAISGSSAGIA